MDITKYTVENEKINKGAERIKYNRAVSETYDRIAVVFFFPPLHPTMIPCGSFSSIDFLRLVSL